jgi:hypothetical protein
MTKAASDEQKILRDQLVGAWTLNSCVERDIETGLENYPFGERPLGLILYTPDGYVSAQLQRPERLPFAEEDLMRATAEEYAAAGSWLLHRLFRSLFRRPPLPPQRTGILDRRFAGGGQPDRWPGRTRFA